MSKELDKLKELGAQKIYEDTHIPLKYVQSVIYESFEGLNKVQFLGFVSILEREYNQNLSALKDTGLEYFNENPQEEHVNSAFFIAPKKARNFKLFYILVALLIFVFVAYKSLEDDSLERSSNKIDNSAIDSVTQNINATAKETVSTETDEQEVNATDNNITEIKIIEPVKIAKMSEPIVVENTTTTEVSLILYPTSKLWIAYINKTDGINRQGVIKEKLELDPSKIWLLSLGHGHVNIEVNGKTTKFNKPDNLLFIYEDGELKELSKTEFKRLNKGRLW